MSRLVSQCPCECHEFEDIDTENLTDDEWEIYQKTDYQANCLCVRSIARDCWRARRRRKECLRCHRNEFLTDWKGTYFCCREDMPRCNGQTLKGTRCQLEGLEESENSLYYCGYHLPELPHDALKDLVYSTGQGWMLRDRIGRLGQVQFRIVEVSSPNTGIIIDWCRPKDILRTVERLQRTAITQK